jgi:hypothetical protein
MNNMAIFGLITFASIQEKFKWMRGGLRLRQHGDQDDQHLNKEIRRHSEELQDILEVQDTSVVVVTEPSNL